MDPRPDDDSGAEPAASPGWVARRLGITPATLRTWHYRYGVGPTGRSPGGHRRYSRVDIDRLARMRKLVLSGLPVAEAARASAHPGSDEEGGPQAAQRARRRRGGGRRLRLRDAQPQMRELAGAAMALDQPAVEQIVVAALRAHGVVHTWERLVVPVLHGIGERYERCGDCIEVEHLFAQTVSAALAVVASRRRRWSGSAPVLLACPEGEFHTLALQALAAALAEMRCPSRLLGASVPAAALASAVQRIGPRAVFLWAQAPEFARRGDLDAVPQQRPPVAVLVGGAGWAADELPGRVERMDTLAGAVDRLCPGLEQVPA